MIKLTPSSVSGAGIKNKRREIQLDFPSFFPFQLRGLKIELQALSCVTFIEMKSDFVKFVVRFLTLPELTK